MSVHQIDEYYIHVEIPEDKKDVIICKLIDDSMSYNFDNDYLIVDEFTSEHEAESYENDLQELLD